MRLDGFTRFLWPTYFRLFSHALYVLVAVLKGVKLSSHPRNSPPPPNLDPLLRYPVDKNTDPSWSQGYSERLTWRFWFYSHSLPGSWTNKCQRVFKFFSIALRCLQTWLCKLKAKTKCARYGPQGQRVLLYISLPLSFKSPKTDVNLDSVSNVLLLVRLYCQSNQRTSTKDSNKSTRHIDSAQTECGDCVDQHKRACWW